jgi:hypothetical protein
VETYRHAWHQEQLEKHLGKAGDLVEEDVEAHGGEAVDRRHVALGDLAGDIEIHWERSIDEAEDGREEGSGERKEGDAGRMVELK